MFSNPSQIINIILKVRDSTFKMNIFQTINGRSEFKEFSIPKVIIWTKNLILNR